MENRRTANHSYISNDGKGKYGKRERQLPHEAGVMEIFNKAWNETQGCTILKYWIKIQCSVEPKVQNMNSILISLIQDPDVRIDLTVTNQISRMEIDLAFGMQTTQSIQEAFLICDTLQNEVRRPMSEITERAY